MGRPTEPHTDTEETPQYLFTVYMIGSGDSPEAAWQDAVHAFGENPVFPDKDQYRRIEE